MCDYNERLLFEEKLEMARKHVSMKGHESYDSGGDGGR